MIYLLAGHTPKGMHPDPGAVANGYKEAELTMELRDIIADKLRGKGCKVYEDEDSLRLAEVLSVVNSTEKDIVCDIHFNAGPEAATGIEVMVPARSTEDERDLARKICALLSSIMKIRNRGVKTESDGQHKSLGVMRELGINILIEMCFITNKTDMTSYQANKAKIADELMYLLIEYDNKYL